MRLDVKFEGVDDLVIAVKKLEGSMQKKRLLLKLFRQQAKPYLRALRSGGFIKDAEKPVKYSRNKAIVYKPGNLRRSMQIRDLRNKHEDNAVVWIGPRVKKAEGSGYYGRFQLPRGGSKYINPKNDWRGDAWDSVKGQIESGMTSDLRDYLKKNAAKLGFQVR